MKEKSKIKCHECKVPSTCCQLGTWVDLEVAKKIVDLKIKGGDFFHLEKDASFPSGYKVGTSVEDELCTFLTRKGLCSIHKIDYKLKPAECKEFPYEDGKLSPIAPYLCVGIKAKHKKYGKIKPRHS